MQNVKKKNFYLTGFCEDCVSYTGKPLKKCLECNKCSINAGCYYFYSQAPTAPTSKPSAQAQVPSLHGHFYPVLAGTLHSHPSVSWSLGPYQTWQGVSIRASQSSLIANGSRDSRASPLLGEPGQETEGQCRPLSQASQPVPLRPYPSGPLEHMGHRTTLSSQS